VSTRASVYRHPVHPMLIVYPLGLWVFSVICYLIYLLGNVRVWHTVALYAMGGGIIGGAAAAIPGLIDFLPCPNHGCRQSRYRTWFRTSWR